ncbi:MAG: SsrA-binding protein [Candidatus Peregrinibacteria bacterium Gr01-1014_25]|nr:MAG: SsrA-binding protein [Candidatus Peregrinibacteria bacterium Gr01-1014_25]
MAHKIVAQNRRARFDYDLLDTAEAGIALTGQEVKACRAGQVNLSGAYVSFPRTGAAVLRHVTITPYKHASNVAEAPERDRTLLLGATELKRLREASEQQGVTVLPIEVRAGRFIKVVLAVARGRKKVDKRQAIRRKDIEKRLRKGEEV